MEILGVKLEATKIIWILINEDADEVLAKLIAAGLDYHKNTGSTIQVLCTEAMKNIKETFEEEKINDFLDTILASFVDNHNDLGELLVDQTGDFMSDKIKQLLGNVETVLEGAFLEILELLANNSDDEIIDLPSVPSGENLKDITRVTDYINRLIIELTIKKLELPSRTSRDRDSIVNAIYRRCQIMAIKNMASKTSKITEKVKSHGDFIVEQVHANRDNMLNSAKCVLIIKDLDKLIVDIKNKPK